MNTINLNNCKKGDILISKHGAILSYVKPLNSELEYYDHEVKYLYVDEHTSLGVGNGTRNNDGTVFKHNRLETDHDIVAIIPSEIFKKLIKK